MSNAIQRALSLCSQLNGEWLNGEWLNGEWLNGEWLNGEWLNGEWLNGGTTNTVHALVLHIIKHYKIMSGISHLFGDGRPEHSQF